MNIHITDKEEFEKLIYATILTTEMGSSMYGTSDENSDTDYLHIYIPSINEKNSFVNSHHQIQYKENNTDHIFINLHSFIRNCLNGDSTLNMEVLFSDSMKNSKELNFLYEMRNSFINYKIVRSYVGFGNRDLKQVGKQVNDLEKNKKVAHAYRCLKFAEMLLNGTFNPYINTLDTLYIKDKIIDIKASKDYKVRDSNISEIKTNIESLRNDLNDKLNNHILHIPVYMKCEDQYLLDVNIHDLIESDYWKNKQNWYMNMLPFYKVNENDNIIEYGEMK